ncbi:MATE family efflux transporter [Anoxybacteroides rupiense]
MMSNHKHLSLFALTWPIFIETLLYMLMGSADTLMLSHYSDQAVAAVGVANQIIFLVIVMFDFVAMGTAILVAQYIGAKDVKNTREVALASISANFFFSFFLSAILLLFGKQLLYAMKLPDELLDEAYSYLAIVGGFLFVQALMMTAGAILKSHGYTRDTMYITVGMNILHIIGNYISIFGPFGLPVLGVKGVAISTTISRIIALIAIFFLLAKRTNLIPSLSRFAYLPMHHIRSLLKIGIPAAGENLAYNTAQMVITYFITWMGTEALTAKIYTQNLIMFVFLFGIAVGQGTQILVGYFVGAKQYEQAYARCLKSLYSAISISIAMAFTCCLLAEPLLSFFTHNKEIIEMGKTLLLLTILLEPGRSFNLVIISSLRAAGDVQFPVYMGIASMWGVSVVLSYILGIYFGLGLIGIWISFIADEWLRGLFMLWRWRSKTWCHKSLVQFPVGTT